ncbi:unnamed protein product [Candida verbasci]|uniref:SAC3/GANP/THP3 conserved domain-containing protein n=1 Tax=Candida verbasci TaxID=1227364 RepID=A0A9W4XCR1_9ASCO|nr:unnamed protein product [Candida verbasci]
MSNYNEVQPTKLDQNKLKKRNKKKGKNSLGFNPNASPVGGASSRQFGAYSKSIKSSQDDQNEYNENGGYYEDSTNNGNDQLPEEEPNEEALKSAQDFVERSLAKAEKLTAAKYQECDKQIKQILHMARDEGKININDWIHQRVPLLDGGCPFELECDRIKNKKSNQNAKRNQGASSDSRGDPTPTSSNGFSPMPHVPRANGSGLPLKSQQNVPLQNDVQQTHQRQPTHEQSAYQPQVNQSVSQSGQYQPIYQYSQLQAQPDDYQANSFQPSPNPNQHSSQFQSTPSYYQRQPSQYQPPIQSSQFSTPQFSSYTSKAPTQNFSPSSVPPPPAYSPSSDPSPLYRSPLHQSPMHQASGIPLHVSANPSSYSAPFVQRYSASPPPPPPITNSFSGEKRSGYGDYDSIDRKKQRLARFETNQTNTNQTERKNSTNSNGVIIGKSKDLEKNYLRLTAAPDPMKVRSQPVLEKSLKYVFKKFEDQVGKIDAQKNYSYIINQLKSIRQDLTVQHIKNDFAIVVYSKNAIVSLENYDLGEFNQCQTQLKHLYKLRRNQDATFKRKFQREEVELQVFKLIYMMITKNESEIVKIRLQWITEFSKFHKNPKEEKFIKLVFSLYRANDFILNGNHYRFFQELHRYQDDEDFKLPFKIMHNYLYKNVRIKYLDILTQCYKELPIQFLFESLDFDTMEDCEAFLFNELKLTKPEGDSIDSKIAKTDLEPLIAKISKVDIKGQI